MKRGVNPEQKGKTTTRSKTIYTITCTNLKLTQRAWSPCPGGDLKKKHGCLKRLFTDFFC